MSFIFDKIEPLNNVSKDALNQFSVHSRAKDSFRSVKKKKVFILHFGRQANGGDYSACPCRPWLRTVLAYVTLITLFVPGVKFAPLLVILIKLLH